MPRGARSERLGDSKRFMEYATANVTEWYKFVNGRRGREVKNGDVRLVVGSDKTSSWGIATFVNQTQQNSCRLKFCPSEGDSACPYTWSEYSGATDVRAGPNSNVSRELRIDSDPPDFQIENQCLFVHTLNITLTDDVWADIHSTLGSVHVDPRHVRDHSASNHPHLSTPTGGGSNLSPSPGVQYGTQRATSSNYGLENADLTSDNNPGMFISGPPGRLVGLVPLKNKYIIFNFFFYRLPTHPKFSMICYWQKQVDLSYLDLPTERRELGSYCKNGHHARRRLVFCYHSGKQNDLICLNPLDLLPSSMIVL